MVFCWGESFHGFLIFFFFFFFFFLMQTPKIRTARFAKIDENDTEDSSNELDSSKTGSISIMYS